MEEPVDELLLVVVMLLEDAIEKEVGSMELGFGLWRGALFAQGEREGGVCRERKKDGSCSSERRR